MQPRQPLHTKQIWNEAKVENKAQAAEAKPDSP